VIKDQQENNTFMLDFTRLVYQYVQVYLANDAKNALQYLCLFSLYSPKQGYHNQSMIQLAKSNICKYTMTSKEFKAILGSVNDERIVSSIDLNITRSTHLIYLSSVALLII
jgi:hypothetical protein